MKNTIKNKNFFSGGRALFTVSKENGPKYTFRIDCKLDHTRKQFEKNGPYFVKVFKGTENNNYKHYKYLGLYNSNIGKVFLTGKSLFSSNSVEFKTVNWAISTIFNGLPIPNGYFIQHEGKCSKCGRVLTTPESINNGIGPECFKQLSLKF